MYYRPYFGVMCCICLAFLWSGPVARSQTPGSMSAPPSAVPVISSPPPFTDRMNEFPSLWQEDPRAGFPGDGSKFCMPVAASNALMWLVDHGYPNLLPASFLPRAETADRAAQQIALVKMFTASPYAVMKEDLGASAGWIARGIARYITDRGYRVEQIDWRPVAAPMPDTALMSPPSTSRFFTLDEIKSALRAGAGVWLLVGRYKPVAGVPDTYRRISGHGLTLVGYGLDETGHPDPNVLIVHDPAKHRADGIWPNDRWHLGIMEDGHWAGKGADADKPGKSMAGRYRFFFATRNGTRENGFVLLEEATVLRLYPAVLPSTSR